MKELFENSRKIPYAGGNVWNQWKKEDSLEWLAVQLGRKPICYSLVKCFL
jgi:hypothetical protein